MILQHILDLVSVCVLKNVTKVIISPGSRSAALTLAFARHPNIECFVVPDERSAGFVALGMAQISDETVALVCTSGTAASNYLPAITEAFFQEIPLLVLTTDRPPEWINQYDGQTIFQNGMFGKNVKASEIFPVVVNDFDSKWYANRLINDLINQSQQNPKGPVHLNIPIKEPFYPIEGEIFEFDTNVKIIKKPATITTLGQSVLNELFEIIKDCKTKLIAVGQGQVSEQENLILSELSEKLKIPILGDVISNLNFEGKIDKQDIFLQKVQTNLSPELLITCGKSFISKNLKLFLRKNPPKYHFHFSYQNTISDPFQSVTHLINADIFAFFSEFLNQNLARNENQFAFFEDWKSENSKAKLLINRDLLKNVWNEFYAVRAFMQVIPKDSVLHLANSLSVRYANFVGIDSNKNVQILANRGTSGIDGSVSSAVGNALNTKKNVFLLIGDMAFFYDKNGLWHHHVPQNLKIVLLNNQGGNIFRMIDGPNKQAELDQYFVTAHKQNAKFYCDELQIKYFEASDFESFENTLSAFMTFEGMAVMEVKTDPVLNQAVFDEFKAAAKS